MRIAYTAPGVPPSTAYTPIPAWAGQGLGPYANGQDVAGQPGTLGVPVGLGDFGDGGMQVNGQPVRGSGAGYAQGSGTYKLGAWYPQLYWLRKARNSLNTPGMGPSIYSDNQLPVPAADPLGRAAVLGVPPVFLGQKDVAQPPAGPRWVNWVKTAMTTGEVGPSPYGS